MMRPPVMQSVFMQGIVAGQIGAASGEGYNSRMTRDNFRAIQRAFCARAPFKPFVVELISGARLLITHREAMRLEDNNDLIVYRRPNGARDVFECYNVVRFTEMVVDDREE